MPVPEVKPKLPRLLLIDDSRIVRASVSRHVREAYEVIEAVDGEEGWKLLAADPRVKVVISDLSMPHLDGYQLLERIRASEVPRVRDVPVIVISGSEDESERKRAAGLGATDFITKGIGTVELMARLEALTQLAKAKEDLDASRVAVAEQATTDPLTQLFTMGFMVKQGSAMYSYARRHTLTLAVLRLGLDNFEAVRARVGDVIADQIVVAVAKLLDSRMRREDCVARTGPAEFGIMSPATTGEAAARFAQRVAEEIRAAKITWQGQKISISVSIGACDSVSETVESFADLLVIAQQRMQAAFAAGGDRVLFAPTLADDAAAVAAKAKRDVPSIEDALAMLAAGRSEALAPHAAELARRLYPLVQFCDELFTRDPDVSAEVKAPKSLARTHRMKKLES